MNNNNNVRLQQLVSATKSAMTIAIYLLYYIAGSNKITVFSRLYLPLEGKCA